VSRFINEADRLQGTSLPESIAEYVPEENSVRVIDAFVSALDIGSLGFEVAAKATGRPGHHPTTMLSGSSSTLNVALSFHTASARSGRENLDADVQKNRTISSYAMPMI
jgi:hypothetical protein